MTARQVHAQAATFADEMQTLADSTTVTVDNHVDDQARVDAQKNLNSAQQEAAAVVARATKLQELSTAADNTASEAKTLRDAAHPRSNQQS